MLPHTYAFGVAFEHFVINEIVRLQSYYRKDFRLSFLRTRNGLEVDIIIERPGCPRALVEIKSTEKVTSEDVRALAHLAPDISNSDSFCLSRDTVKKKIDGVFCLPWFEGLAELGLTE